MNQNSLQYEEKSEQKVGFTELYTLTDQLDFGLADEENRSIYLDFYNDLTSESVSLVTFSQ